MPRTNKYYLYFLLTITNLVIIIILTDNNKLKNKMSNTLRKIRFSNYEPIDLRDIESYSIAKNVDDTSPIRDEEMNEEIEREFKDAILREIDIVFNCTMYSVYEKGNYEKRYKKITEVYFSEEPFRNTVVHYLTSNEKVFANHFGSIKKWEKKHKFAKEDIFKYLSDCDKKELREYLILEDRKKLFTVEFCLKDETTVKWGAYKTKEEAEIVYNKVDDYFKKTSEHFYKNLDNQEIYSL